MAVNPWVGYDADAYVSVTSPRRSSAATVDYKEVKEEVAWQGLATGSIDIIVENWGHPDLVKKYIDRADGTAEDAGLTGNDGHHRLVRPAVDGGEVPGHHSTGRT